MQPSPAGGVHPHRFPATAQFHPVFEDTCSSDDLLLFALETRGALMISWPGEYRREV